MQLPCYRCGANVEEGCLFCPSCNAPQIKVAVPQSAANEPPPRSSAPGADLIPPAASPVSYPQAGAIQWKKYRRLALPLSFVAGVGLVLSFLPGLLLLVIVIIFAVQRYSRDHQGPLLASQGAKMGALSGFISFVVVAAAGALELALNFEEAHRQAILEFQRRFAGNSDPMVQQIAHGLSTNQGFITFVVIGVVLSLVILLIGSSFIGAITVTFFANRNRR